MKKNTLLCLLILSFISLSTEVFAGCRIPKEHVVCHRQCFYNYYGPGAHCNETCLKQKIPLKMVYCKTRR